eukprot:CAMPEP_0204521892 /NCGR_PEP_ID=MMETSP0661-20131031/6022_1 /ASSEMBLY_ACC=CAM_ASM_000606 /TAXON_ID=109239 /ORGANISM="Alexandrium margalefi, Strain AMGDE01CS-322" /LENGTH=124 /DNA_ID=CAMNT_0051527517 /DNA_START=479 /DNA_END=853 /DNA_ORIENTATION=+
MHAAALAVCKQGRVAAPLCAGLVEGGLLHNADELFLVDLTVLVLIKLLDHAPQLVVCELLAEVTGNSLQVAEGDLPPLVLIEELEGLFDLVHGILCCVALDHDLLEGLEIDVAGLFAIVAAHEI